MREQVPVDPDARAEVSDEGSLHEATAELAYQRLLIVNVVYHGAADGGSTRGIGTGSTGTSEWVLIDVGIPGSTRLILNAVERRFGKGSRPAAIVMTHGHFDHVGALEELAERWDVPVLVHELELPYLDGSTSYLPPDPSVGGGMMSTLSRFYPRGPVNVGQWLEPLPADGTIPFMPGWRWIHTPGHTAGHISLWHETNRALIAGDAFITTNQESAYAVTMQRPEIHGPPMYFTPDWDSARESVRLLAALEPELVITGHGPALHGSKMREALHTLARDFDRIAVPEKGRYVDDERLH
jgi:glyoxylase-like metal-dependent hydrolase (beta-lactamase superfamily II)